MRRPLLLSRSLFVVATLAAAVACEPKKEGGNVEPPAGGGSVGDIDGDGTPDATDADIDGDGIDNGTDLDMDGDRILNDLDDDMDGDGTNNADDTTPAGGVAQPGAYGDLDSDGTPNAIDTDDNNDGLPDGVAGLNDCNGDGVPETSEATDCDGYCDGNIESGGYVPCDDGAVPGSGAPDRDGDGIPDATDPDDDNDGIVDGGDGNPNGNDPCVGIEFPDPSCTPTAAEGEGEGEGEGSVVPPPNCRTDSYDAGDVLPPRILVVLDKSGSMNDPATGFAGSKWDSARTVLSDVVTELSQEVNFGLMLFPPRNAGDQEVCDAGTVEVPFGNNAANQIVQTLDAIPESFGGTPTAPTLTVARATLAALPAQGGQRAVILATDGGPNCNGSLDGGSCRCVSANAANCSQPGGQFNCLDDNNAIGSARQLNDAGFPVFVLGLPGSENFTDVLSGLANAGGTGQFYSASSSAALSDSLLDIATRIGSCRFDLPGAANPNNVTVTIGSATVPRDRSKQNGWDTVDVDTIELFGAACDQAVNSATGVSVQTCF